jgi:putative transposase
MYKMFARPELAKLCEELLYEIGERHRIRILGLSVMPDHIYVIVELPPSMALSKALNLLKGASAYELFKRQQKFRLRYPKGHF